MRTFDLVLKDLFQVLREKQSLLFFVAMPVVFTFFMGFAYRGAVQPADPRLVLGWADADGGALSQQLYAALEGSAAVRLVEVDPGSVARLPPGGGLREPGVPTNTAGLEPGVPSGGVPSDVAGVLVVPAGFSNKALAGEDVQLTLMADALSTTGQSLYQVLRAPVVQVMSAAQIARLDVETLDAQRPFADEAARATERSAAFEAAAQAWAEARQEDAWVRVEKAVAAEPESAPLGGNPYNQTSPGMLVQFAIFGLVSSAQILVLERKSRTLQRMITTAMRPWQIIAGHLLAMFALVFLQTALLIVFGQLVLGVDYLREPVGTLLVAVSLGLWVSSMGLLIGVFARGDQQVVLYSMIAMFLFTGLGGAWFPLEGAGKAFATIGHLTPGAWAMDGFQNILIRGLGLSSAWRPTAILLAYAAGFFALAVWRFRAGEET
jgi:ABC-2 type transport system permease protein